MKKYKFRGKHNTLNFRNFFVDGLGFLGFGPKPSEEGQNFEGRQELSCFGTEGDFYGFEDERNLDYSDVTILSSVERCFEPLSNKDSQLKNINFIKINQLRELEMSPEAIEIVV